MIRTQKRTLWVLLLLSSFPLLAAAQENGRVSEEEVNLEKVLIDANREKLLGNFDNAITLLRDILKKDSRNAAAAYELARIYESTGDDEKAIKSAKDAIEWEQDNPWYYKFLADLYQKRNRNQEAAELYEQIVRLEPGSEFNYFRWAYFLVRANRINEALRVYDELENRLGINEEVIRRKHALYMGTGDFKKAARELERLIEAYPSDMDYRHLLAGFYEQIGEQEQAREIYRQILRLEPNNAKAQLALAGQPENASDEMRYLQSLKPVFRQPEVDIDLKIGKILPFITKVAEDGNRSLADATLELTSILEAVHPNEAKGFSAAADLLYYSGRPKEALQKYLKTLELDDTVFLVWEQTMRIYQEERQFDELLQLSERAMDYFPNQAFAYYAYGTAAHELGDSEEARSVLQQALLIAGNNLPMKLDIQSRLGLVYNSLEDYGSADKAFEAALQIKPDDPAALNAYAYALASRGQRLKKALEMAKTALEKEPGQPDYQSTYGWALYRSGEYKKAKEWMGKALANGADNNATTLEHYGDVLYQLDDAAQALEYWKMAREKGGASGLLDRKIANKKLYE